MTTAEERALKLAKSLKRLSKISSISIIEHENSKYAEDGNYALELVVDGVPVAKYIIDEKRWEFTGIPSKPNTKVRHAPHY